MSDIRQEIQEYYGQTVDGETAPEIMSGGIFSPDWTGFLQSMDERISSKSDDPTLLYLGCGAGDEFSFWQRNENDNEYFGLDITPNMAEFIDSEYNAHGIIGDGMKLPIQENSFTAVWSGMIHYYGEEKQRQFLDECYRVLEDEGIAVINFKTGEFEPSTEDYPLEEKRNSRSEAYQLAEETGFDLLEIVERDNIRDYFILQKNE